MDAVQERIDDYLAFGVPRVWLLNPRNRRAFIYTAAGSARSRTASFAPAIPASPFR